MRTEHGKSEPAVAARHDAWTVTPSCDKQLPTGNVNMSVLETVVT